MLKKNTSSSKVREYKGNILSISWLISTFLPPKRYCSSGKSKMWKRERFHLLILKTFNRRCTQSEFAEGHLDGAELFPLHTLEQTCKGWDKTSSLMLVCKSGMRAQKAAHLLSNLGFTDVEVLEGVCSHRIREHVLNPYSSKNGFLNSLF